MIVNVASVPMRSPFRYPGGKTWLVPRVRAWLASMPRMALFLEPFAGGGIVSLTVAAEDLADRVLMVELDADVAAVWQCILEDPEGGAWLSDRILEWEMTSANVDAVLGQAPTTIRERAFATILKNRVNRGGILAPGAGRIKEGEGGKGLSSRWYPETLAGRIHGIVALRHRIEIVQGDGPEVMARHPERADVACFIDPPYTAGATGKRAGKRLYAHADLDHEALFASAAQMAGPVLLTYDHDPEVCTLAAQHGLDYRPVPMKSTHHIEMTELLISRDLRWV